ncbi:MAG: DUF935 family protein [Mariprofundaceae bacterium]|nr:DUF935 family protein [Mariprofundaceae bacterium]
MSNIFQFGRKKQTKTEIKETIKGGGLYDEADVHGIVSYLSTMPDMDETLLAAGIYREDLRKLETDDEITACLETRREAVLATPRNFEGKDSDVTFIKENLEPMLDDVIRQIWDATPYGYSVGEAIYAKDGRRIVLDKMLFKPFEWFTPKADGDLLVRGSEEKLDTEYKFFLTRRRASYRQPYGEALLSKLYWAWYFRMQGWEHWDRWLKRYATPPLVGIAAHGKLDELRNALMRCVNAPVIALPEGSSMDVADTSGGARHFPDFEEAVTKRIQKVILGQTLTSDVGKSGSFAAAKVHDGIRDDRRVSDCKMVQSTVQRMIDALCTLNGMAKVVFTLADERALNQARAERDATLVNAGIVNLSQGYLLRAYDFEESDLEEIVEADIEGGGAAKADEKNNIKSKSKGKMQFAADDKQPRFTKAQQAIEDLGDDAIKKAGNPIDEAAIKDVIMAAESADDMLEKLAALAGGYDVANFAELAERALFTADVFGYAQADKGKL